MRASFGKVHPDIIFSSVTGPGVCLPRRNGLWQDLIVVVSYPSFVHLGFPECVPALDIKKMTKQAEDNLIPSLGVQIRNIIVHTEDSYLMRCFNGDFWTIYSAFSPVSQSFGAEGQTLVRAAVRCISRDMLRRCSAPRVSRSCKPALSTEDAIKLMFCEDILKGKFSPVIVNPRDSDIVLMEHSAAYASKRVRAAKLAYLEKKNGLPEDISVEELNSMLIALRMNG